MYYGVVAIHELGDSSNSFQLSKTIEADLQDHLPIAVLDGSLPPASSDLVSTLGAQVSNSEQPECPS